jgi:predicted nucleic acid-binding protein
MTTTSITAYELLKGAEISAKPKENVHLIKDILSNLHVLDFDATSSEKASKIYTWARQKAPGFSPAG